MARIRVNTEDLKNKAKDFDSASEAWKRAGDDILAAAMALPSYDGQLSGPARKMGYEFQKQARELSAALAGDAESLRKTAQAFEEVDNKTVDTLGENKTLMSASPINGGPGGEEDEPRKQGGNPDALGYKDYGDYVVIWKNGESLTIVVTDLNRAAIEKYENSVDEYCKNLADLLETWSDWILRGIGTTQIILLIYVLVLLGLVSEYILPIIAAAKNILPETLDKIKLLADGIIGGAGWEMRDIMVNLGLLLDPMDPYHYVQDIKNFIQYSNAATQAYLDAENTWDSLNPSPKGPEFIPAPTPPLPTQTPTPNPSSP
jgi:hypothetical protein